MPKDRDYGNYSGETTIIDAFEAYEESVGVDLGEVWEDFGDWFLLYRDGFMAGGNS